MGVGIILSFQPLPTEPCGVISGLTVKPSTSFDLSVSWAALPQASSYAIVLVSSAGSETFPVPFGETSVILPVAAATSYTVVVKGLSPGSSSTEGSFVASSAPATVTMPNCGTWLGGTGDASTVSAWDLGMPPCALDFALMPRGSAVQYSQSASVAGLLLEPSATIDLGIGVELALFPKTSLDGIAQSCNNSAFYTLPTTKSRPATSASSGVAGTSRTTPSVPPSASATTIDFVVDSNTDADASSAGSGASSASYSDPQPIISSFVNRRCRGHCWSNHWSFGCDCVDHGCVGPCPSPPPATSTFGGVGS